MSELPITIETRPTLSIDVPSPDTPPRREVVFFDYTALIFPDTMQSQLAAWPPETPLDQVEDVSEEQQTVYKAIAVILKESRSGEKIEYDDATWGAVMNDKLYTEHKQASERAASTETDKLRAKTAVRGLAVYSARLRQYATEMPNVA